MRRSEATTLLTTSSKSWLIDFWQGEWRQNFLFYGFMARTYIEATL